MSISLPYRNPVATRVSSPVMHSVRRHTRTPSTHKTDISFHSALRSGQVTAVMSFVAPVPRMGELEFNDSNELS
jgi:hypothetical protein